MNSKFIREGYWSISVQKHLKEFKSDCSGLDEFDNLNIAGKCGRLAGIIRGSMHIDSFEKLKKMANQVGISPSELKRTILPIMEDFSDKRIKVRTNTIGDIIGVEEYIYDNKTVMGISGNIFQNINPSSVERIAIDSLDNTKKLPHLESELYQKLTNDYSESDIRKSITFQQQFALLKKVSTGKEAIYSNEYVWGNKHEKIAHAVSNIDLGKRENLKDVISMIQNKQGIPSEQLRGIDENLLDLSKRVGILDPTKIITRDSLEKEFLFSSNLIDKAIYDEDILDDVKLFIASIRFGENFTKYSTLNQTEQFIKALINRDKVGPHSANGTDYTLLESRGIIQVEHAYNDRYYMKLLRKDVAEKALSIIQSDEFNIGEEIYNKEAADAFLRGGAFISAEQSRMQLGKSTQGVAEAESYLLSVLREESL